MLADPAFVEEPGEEDREGAQALLETYPAETLVAALVRLYRASVPVPEEVTDPAYTTERRPAVRDRATVPVGTARVGEGEPAVWFRVNLGRHDAAEPRRLLPMLSRRGRIGRGDIGAIRIFDRETKFEVRAGAAEDFARSFAERGSPDVAVERVPDEAAPGQRESRSPRAAKHRRVAAKPGPKPKRQRG